VNNSITYGVDWSDRTRPTSHCWFPYKSTDLSSSHPCAYFSCKDPKFSQTTECVHCESCSIYVHTYHLIDFQQSQTITNFIPPCRPSFSESSTYNEMIDQNKFDRHYWARVSMLTKPCALCKRKSTSTSFFGSGRPSTMPSIEPPQSKLTLSTDNTSPKTLASSSGGFQCLWCSRGYHRRCWDQIFTQDDKNKCDYGILK